MENVEDSTDAAPESRSVTDDGGRDLLDRDVTTTNNDDISNVLQDSEDNETTPPMANPRKKAYTCSTCGKPLKGHTCNVSRISIPTYFSRQGKRRRTTKRRFTIEGATDEQLHAATTEETKKGAIESLGEINNGNEKRQSEPATEIDKTFWDTETEGKVDHSRNWYEDDDSNDRTDVHKRATPRKRVIRLESSSEDDDHDLTVNDEVVLPHKSVKRAYMCRMCGVPRKGHFCRYVGGGSTKSQSHQPLSTSSRKHNNNIQRKRNRFEQVSVMERTEFNIDSDSSGDDDDDDDDDNRVPATDILVPAHIFLDEVHSYIMQQLHQRNDDETKQLRTNTKKMIHSEKLSLQIWARNVHAKFEKLNERAYNDMQRINRQKQIEQSITKERDMILALRNKIRCIQNDNRTIADHIVALRNEHNRNIATSKFLSAIDAIRNNN